MNTNKLKAYAPKARVAFMEAVKNRAAKLGIFEDRISEIMIDGDSAIIEKEVYTRKQGQQRNQLVKRIEALGTHDGKFVHKDGFNQFINETAFTWFNRLTAIRYMEVNEYLDHGFRVLSKAEGAQFGEGFEILNSAAEVADELGLNKDQIIDMVLDGNKEEELYRTLLLGQCHQLSEAMPFMFEKLDDSTELLLPDNLTKTDSILKDLVNDIPEDNWQEIEVIGWLYQFYISEHKDAVIGKVVKREDIPAATQLFTPNWIVKYLVQNSLGRQWLATYPDSELKDKMEYYITPAEQSDDVIEQLKAITPTSIDPEGIKVLDPACGSGHILVEVYEVLREIYLERGYRLREIPELILTKNIYGLDIDDRAAQMAAFAVLMKAREDDKRIFTRDIKLNIHSIQSTENLNINQLWADLDLDNNKQAGSINDLFAEPQLVINELSAENKVYIDLLHYLKEQFIDAKNLGSLIEVGSQYLESLTTLQEKLTDKEQGIDPTAKQAAKLLLPIIEQAAILARQHDVVVANPPYMGSSYQQPSLKQYLKGNFKGYEKDLFSAFIIRNLQLTKDHGDLGFMTPFVWMFISSYEQLRTKLINDDVISSLIQLEYSGFDGATVPICTFTVHKHRLHDYKSCFIRLSDFKGSQNQAPRTLEAISNRDCGWFFEFKQKKLLKIPGSPVAYWANQSILDAFENNKKLNAHIETREGLTTGCNDLFLRLWHEVSHKDVCWNAKAYNQSDEFPYDEKWFPCVKGGDFRRWEGNKEYIVNWLSDGTELKKFADPKTGRIRSHNYNGKYAFRAGITWSAISSADFSVRYVPEGYKFDTKGPMGFTKTESDSLAILAFLNSAVTSQLIKMLAPTLDFKIGHVLNLPFKPELKTAVQSFASEAVSISSSDWSSQETSWNFVCSPLTKQSSELKNSSSLLSGRYESMIAEQDSRTQNLKRVEEAINEIFINAFMLENVSPAVSLDKVSLICNPLYRYTNKLKICLPEKRKSDTLSELISYSFGCMVGRYSIDREGLVYAHSGNNGFKKLVADGAYNTFSVDDDGIVPLANEDWVFEDDATTRFREFVKTVWGDDHLQENLDFVAESLCLDAIKAKKGESSLDTIRRYFSMQFYKDHLKTYKKRPIYWLFSSGKAKAFECLVYLHRYNEGTLSRMRTEYVTPLMGKLESRKNILEDSKATASGAELRAIDKELKTIEKKQAELVTFDEELKHLAEMKISLDLDDGVKANYGKFGNLLADVKAIHGKNPEVIK
ncbi:BREX-1 system adenine-specific DNA-methyltransferase PglX [Vibrio splendidus]|uniref:BREX-1 system adenine-specific DNA-methyltransferase PglX n=1 Tax=Vibrio splendidus TaxID=29497 RepID=UPI001FB1EAB4|nr:BREX-1 system adenine-specific DNA-methyltransferase PglX [Vibrio splendidus]UOE85042.1 BREX-1 system adenine-specific DNA-methyltransferase PglX [Vibrio splendidus]UOE89475.1 BREX-1 system adenine-specific DNA-methyltransferase PglX [Vibrio splendidus]